MKRLLVIITGLMFTAGYAQFSSPDARLGLRAVVEAGAFGFQSHKIQFGPQGTVFDYVKSGQQNILFPFERYSLELVLRPRHTLVALYQPLDVRTVTTLTERLIVDSDTFEPGTPMNLRYGFDFYRLSWLYDLWKEPDRELGFGLSLQLRNASIFFASLDGEKQRVYQDLGPVPILKARLVLPLNRSVWLGSEIDGFYAQGSVVTGSTNVESSFKGAILDASIRLGARFNRFLDGFVNLRYLGGGAEGQQKNPENPGASGYTSNWLGALSFSFGIMVH
uniref:Outer membrane protein beta-barrel domain-containing protein n=1 Tax=candidate division WOR-3 bacterium TaxID=2052148 RepID=A0A7C1SKW2_UNCW3